MGSKTLSGSDHLENDEKVTHLQDMLYDNFTDTHIHCINVN